MTWGIVLSVGSSQRQSVGLGAPGVTKLRSRGARSGLGAFPSPAAAGRWKQTEFAARCSISQERVLANGSDHVRPDAAFDRSLAKSTLERFGCRFRVLFQARSITGLDFAPQRSALTVGNRRIARRGGAALTVDRCG